jgi:8-oxo-dGTP pyrophosphatase MutT (NUDIX family)
VIKKLFGNKWIELRELILPEKGVKGYTYSHETRCSGHIVSVLPYRTDSEGNLTNVMVRREVTPCWEMKPVMSSITGGVEKDADGELDPLATAALELKEEAGLDIDQSEIKSLGTCYGVKSSDTVYHLYATDAADAPEGKAEGDGSHLEKLAWCEWVKPAALKDAMDPLLTMLFVRLVLK